MSLHSKIQISNLIIHGAKFKTICGAMGRECDEPEFTNGRIDVLTIIQKSRYLADDWMENC